VMQNYGLYAIPFPHVCESDLLCDMSQVFLEGKATQNQEWKPNEPVI
jgi:hypothetical protein